MYIWVSCSWIVDVVGCAYLYHQCLHGIGGFSELGEWTVEQVETINDQYMVAGGLPERFSQHAAEICTMALHLRTAVTELAIPNRVLSLRIGIHTGPSPTANS